MSGRWVAVEGSVAYVTDAGDGVELSDVCDSRTPAALRIPAVASLSKLIRDADRIASLEAENERLRDEGRMDEILRSHFIECTGPGAVSCRGCHDTGWMSLPVYRQHLINRLTARPVESGDAAPAPAPVTTEEHDEQA